MESKDLLYLGLWAVIIYILIEWYPPLGWSLAVVAAALMLSKYKGVQRVN